LIAVTKEITEVNIESVKKERETKKTKENFSKIQIIQVETITDEE